MQWLDTGFLLSTKPYGERTLLTNVLTKERGLYKGVLYKNKQSSEIFPGSEFYLSWRARLEEQMGVFHMESEGAFVPYVFVMNDSLKIKFFQSALAITENFLNERDPQGVLYESFKNLMENFKERNWPIHYILYEKKLLETIGIFIKIDMCTVTGELGQMAYISPRTGRAVSKEVGLPYANKLFKIPEYFYDPQAEFTWEEIKDGLNLFSFFLERYHFHKPFPKIRDIIIEELDKKITARV